jgi:two-component system, sensor histidine kinase and response regulator
VTEASQLTEDISAPTGLAALVKAFVGRAEVELRPTKDGVTLMLRQTNPAPAPGRASTDFVAELTRDTRTAITTILHAVELAEESSPPGERAPWVETISDAARLLLRRVENLAELVPAQRAVPSRLVTFDPMALLRDVMDGVVPQAAEKGVELDAVVHGELPDRVLGDATSWRRVMRLLLQHALDETATSADWALHFQAGDKVHQVRLEVGYRGAMDSDLLAWLAAPLGDAAMNHGQAGVNLGLVRRLVEEEMGGSFTVTSDECETRFSCELEWLPGEVAAPEPQRSIKLSGSSMLAVTPDRSLRKVLQLRYAALGIRTMTVDTAEEAKRLLEAADPGAFDLVLVQYSNGEGLELGQWLAASEAWSRLPRMTVSMAGEPGQAATAEASGYQAYLTPPLPLELMRDAFLALLGRAAAGASGELITRFSLAEAASARAKEGQE